jgi:hypothetical protein
MHINNINQNTVTKHYKQQATLNSHNKVRTSIHVHKINYIIKT